MLARRRSATTTHRPDEEIPTSMARDYSGKEIASGVLGAVALVLGIMAIRGVIQPVDGVMADDVPFLAVAGLLAGVVGLYVGTTRGLMRQVAVVGTGVALIGLALFGGAIALDLLLEASDV